MKLFEEKYVTNDPDDFIKLVVNIANILSLCVGFSIFTLIEIGYISLVSLKNIYYRLARRNTKVECRPEKGGKF